MKENRFKQISLIFNNINMCMLLSIIQSILILELFYVHPNDPSSSLKTRRLITAVYLLRRRRSSPLCSAFEGCRYVAENIDPVALAALATPLTLTHNGPFECSGDGDSSASSSSSSSLLAVWQSTRQTQL